METKETIEINDLALTEDQQAGVNGGIVTFEYIFIAGAATPPPPPPMRPPDIANNHNETVVSDKDKDYAPLADLEPVEQVTGGIGYTGVITLSSSDPLGATTVNHGAALHIKPLV